MRKYIKIKNISKFTFLALLLGAFTANAEAPKTLFSITTNGLYIKANNQSTDADGDTLTYKWNFGDGKTSTAKNAGHTYAKAGTYTVNLTVNDGKQSTNASKTITVKNSNNVAPTVSYSYKLNDLYFKATTTASDVDGDTLTYKWDFGDGKTSTAKSAGHTYAKAGTYTVSLTVSDGILTTNVSKTITVKGPTNTAPEVSYTYKVEGLYFKATTTASDVDGDTLTYKWDFGDGKTSTAKSAGHTFAKAGTYTVNLTASDGKLSNNVSKTITVKNSINTEPTVSYTYKLEGLYFKAATIASDADGDTLTYKWDFGDGKTSTAKSAGHTFAKAGTYEIKLSVSDGKTTVSDSKTVTIRTEEPKLGKSFKKLSNDREADEFRCGISFSDNVYCWGHNSAGVLGNPEIFKDKSGNSIETNGYHVVDMFSSTPVLVLKDDGEPLDNVKSVAAGNGHVCAVTYNGDVFCWGQNYHGQIGLGYINQEKPIITSAHKVVKGQQNANNPNIKYLTNIKEVVLAHNSTCALSNDGEVYCWGDNTAKQLGDDYPELDVTEPWKYELSKEGMSLYEFVKAIPYPVKVNFPNSVSKVTKITGGYFAYCSLVENVDPQDRENLYCWGDDLNGLITGDFEQYRSDFENKYYGILTTQDFYRYIVDNWEWKIYEPSGDFYPLYSAPVTKIVSPLQHHRHIFESFHSGDGDTKNICVTYPGKDATQDELFDFVISSNSSMKTCAESDKCEIINIKTTEEIETEYCKITIDIYYRDKRTINYENLTNIVIGDFDGIIYFTTNDNMLHSSNPGYAYELNLLNSKNLNGEQIVDIYNTPDNGNIFVLTDAGKLYSFGGNNRVGQLGLGIRADYSYEYNYYGNYGYDYGTIINIPYIKYSGTREPIENIIDVSVNKRSVCVNQINQEDPTNNILYCWGSSIFGQLGFDNQDGGFSYRDFSSLWTGYSAENDIMDKTSRIVTSPKVVDFFDK